MEEQERLAKIEELSRRLEVLGPLESRVKYRVMAGIFGWFTFVGFVLFIYSFTFKNIQFATFVTLLTFGLLALLLFGLLTIYCFSQLSGINAKNEKRYKIKAKIAELSSLGENVKSTDTGSKEDMLLKMLSEGRITVEEYKKLSDSEK